MEEKILGLLEIHDSEKLSSGGKGDLSERRLNWWGPQESNPTYQQTPKTFFHIRGDANKPVGEAEILTLTPCLHSLESAS